MCQATDLGEIGLDLTPIAALHLISITKKLSGAESTSGSLQTKKANSDASSSRKRTHTRSKVTDPPPKRSKISPVTKNQCKPFEIVISDDDDDDLASDSNPNPPSTKSARPKPQASSSKKKGNARILDPTKIPEQLIFDQEVFQITEENVSATVKKHHCTEFKAGEVNNISQSRFNLFLDS